MYVYMYMYTVCVCVCVCSMCVCVCVCVCITRRNSEKVSSRVWLHSKYHRALTFEIFLNPKP